MNTKLTVAAAALAVSFIATPVLAQTAPPSPAGAPGALPTTLNPSANQAINGIRQQWDQARNALVQARMNANGARQAAARAEQAEAAAIANFDRINTSLINVMAATASRPPVPPNLANLQPQLPPPNVPVAQPGQPQPGQPVPGQPPRP